eukprot:403367900
MNSEQKDFKAVKVQMKSSQKTGETLSRSMLYSGINIFGQLSQLYLQNKEAGGSYNAFSAQVKPNNSAADGGEGSMMNLSQEVLAIFKRMQKKDSTTKIKAFAELDRYLEQIDQSDISQLESDSDELQNLLTFFLYHFCRIIINEPDKKVREAAHQSFSQFIKKAKRRIGPHLKKIFSLWYCSFFDISQEVAQLAKKNFELAFPENKREQVFKIAFKNFLNFANDQLKQSEDQISDSAADLSKAQREDVFDRITSSVLLALANSFGFTKSWSEEEQQHFIKKLIDILDLNVQISNEDTKDKKGKQKQSQSYLWGFLQSNYRGRVRSSCLQFISNLLLNLPQDIVKQHINQLSPQIYKLVGEDNSSLQTTLWREALFNLGKNYPQSWETINIKKDFLPKLYISLKNAGFGAPQALYENFIKFASIFPFYHIHNYTEDKTNKASFKERCNLIREAFTTIYQGLRNDESVAFHSELAKCYYETLAFILLKRIQPLIQSNDTSEDDKTFALEQIKKTIQVPVEDYINNYERFVSKVQNQRNIRHTIPQRVSKLLTDLSERDAELIIFQTVINNIWDSVQLSLDKQNTIRLLYGLIKNKSKYFEKYILENLIIRAVNFLIENVAAEIKDLSKDNIDKAQQKLINLQSLLYKLNKQSIIVPKGQIQLEQIIQTLKELVQKEELAKNVLKEDMIIKFNTLKEHLVKCVVLTINIQDSPIQNQTIKLMLLDLPLSNSLRVKTLIPQKEFQKVNFERYLNKLKQQGDKETVLGFVKNELIGNEKLISSNSIVLQLALENTVQGKPSFIEDKDLDEISQQVLDKIKQHLKDAQVIAFYFQSVKPLLKLTADKRFDQLRNQLFERLLNIKLNNKNYKQLWSLFEEVLKDSIYRKEDEFFNHCQSELKQQLSVCIAHNSSFELETFDKLTSIIKSFVQLCKNKQEIVEEILLQRENFSNLENNSLPLKMFKDLLLSGGIGFDITKLFSQDLNYVWLISELLNSRHLQSLANFMQLKKQLLIFVDTEVIPVLIYQTQNGNEKLVLQICNYMSDQAHSRVDYVYTLENLIKRLIDPGEDYPADEKPVLKIADFKQIFNHVSKDQVQEYLNDSLVHYSLQTNLFLRMIQQLSYFLVDEAQVQEIFKKSIAYLTNQLQQQIMNFDDQFGISLEIFTYLSEYFQSEVEQDLQKNLLIKLLKNSDHLSEDSNVINSVLLFIAKNLNTIGVSKFNSLIIEKQVDFQSFISQYLENEEDDDSTFENFEFEMLQELSETLLVFPSYINSQLNENNLYILISSGIETLQKSAFVLLKYLYENFLPQIEFIFDVNDQLEQLKEEAEQGELEDEESKQQKVQEKQKYKNKLAFKNISEILIELLESPPNINQNEQDQKQILVGQTQLDSIIFGDNKEGCMNTKIYGYFLAWNALLIKIENGRIKCQLQKNSEYQTVLGALNEYLEENYEIYQMLLVSLIAYMPDFKKGLADAFNVQSFDPEYIELQEPKQNALYAVYTLVNFMKSFPSLARKYYSDCDRQLLNVVMPYIKQVVSPAILDNEIRKIEIAQTELGGKGLTFSLFKSTKEIQAYYKQGEIEMTLKIRIPSDYPLKIVEADITNGIKTSNQQQRKWILQIKKILQFQNGDIITAVLSWKNNVEKEIEGVEDCYICYSVVHEQDQSLPKLPCKTCKNKFHAACIRKWFKTSHKSNCPICQNYFF